VRNPFTILIYLILSSSIVAFGQTKTSGYQLVFGKDTFQTATTISKDPFNKNSKREYSNLYRNQFQIITIPRRIDAITVYDVSDVSASRKVLDTVKHIKVSKIVDTITNAELTDIIKSEIKIFNRSVKLRFDEAHFETIQPSGETSFTIDLQKSRISEGQHANEALSSLKDGGYFILHTIWFYDSKGRRHEIECNIAWMLKKNYR
jgi:hypothetical protein